MERDRDRDETPSGSLPAAGHGESREYTTLVNCTEKLENALQNDRRIAHFLIKEKLINKETYTRVNNPIQLLTARQLAGLMITDLIEKVSLHRQNYDTFLDHIRLYGNDYRDIIEILDNEYQKLCGLPSSARSKQKKEKKELQKEQHPNNDMVHDSSPSFHLDSKPDELSRWLMSKGLSEADSKIIRDCGIGGRAFLEITKNKLKELKISVGGVIALNNIQKEVKGSNTSTVHSPQKSSPELGSADSIANKPVQPSLKVTPSPESPLPVYSVLKKRIEMGKMDLLKWTDPESGAEQKINLIREMSLMWSRIGSAIGLTEAQLEGWEKRHLNNQEDCMRSVIRAWMERSNEEYQPTWNGLLKLLKDIDLIPPREKILSAAASKNGKLYGK